jgi:hypothetical protein
LLWRPHAHHRDLLAGAAAKAPRHTGRAKDQHRHLMMTALLRDSTNCARCFRRHRRCTCRHVGSLRNHDQNTQNLLVQKPRCSFTLPVTPTLRGKTSLPPPRIWLDRHCRRPKTCTQPDIRRSSVGAQLAKDAHDGECYIWWSRYLPRPAQTSHRNETLWRKSGS